MCWSSKMQVINEEMKSAALITLQALNNSRNHHTVHRDIVMIIIIRDAHLLRELKGIYVDPLLCT